MLALPLKFLDYGKLGQKCEKQAKHPGLLNCCKCLVTISLIILVLLLLLLLGRSRLALVIELRQAGQRLFAA